MKAKFLKMAGVKSEKDFYKKYPTEESFFQAYPEAKKMAQGGATYPYPGQATADEFFNYGMQGRGAGYQIPVETMYAYGGSSNGPLGYFDDGGSAWNYGQFPAFAQKGNQVQGGDIDAATSARLNNFLVGINKNVDENITKEALAQISQAYPMAAYGMEQSTYDPNMFGANMYQQAADLQKQGDMDAFGNAWNTLGQSAMYKAQKQMSDKLVDYLKKNTKKKQTDTPEVPTYQATTMRAGNAPVGPQITPFDQSFIDMNQNMYRQGGALKKYQTAGNTSGNAPKSSDIEIRKEKYKYYQQRKAAYDKRKEDRAKGNRDLVTATAELNKLQENYNKEYAAAKTDADKIAIDAKYEYPFKNAQNKVQVANNLITLSNNVSNYAVLEADPSKAVYSVKAIQWMDRNPIEPFTYQEGKPNVNPPSFQNRDLSSPRIVLTEDQEFDIDIEEPVTPEKLQTTTPEPGKTTTGTTPKTTTTPGVGGGKKPGLIVPTTGATSAEPESTGQATGTPATKTTTSMVDQSDEERRKAAAYSLAALYGATPEQQEQYWQSIKNSMAGAVSGTPYGYVGQYGVPYKYKRRGYSPYPIATDLGYFPTGTDVQGWISQAVAAGANPEDVQVKYKTRPFGMGRKIVFKANFNPETGKVETKPEVEKESEAPVTPATPVTPAAPAQNYDFVQVANSPTPVNKEEFMKGKIAQDIAYLEGLQNTPTPMTATPEEVESILVAEPRQGFRQGGLHRFLPKAQAGMMTPEGTFAFDNLDINIPIASQLGKAYQKTKGFVDSAKEFTRNLGPDFKVVKKEQAGINLSPYAGQGIMAGMRLAERIAENRNAPDYEKEAAIRRIAPFTSVGTDQGDYSPTGASTGQFRPDDKTYAFNTGNMGAIPGRIMDRGGSIAYSDWSQTPVNGYYGVPQGEFSPYSSWSQSPVKMQSGGAMMQDGVYDLSEDEINAIIQAGGQVEFLD